MPLQTIHARELQSGDVLHFPNTIVNDVQSVMRKPTCVSVTFENGYVENFLPYAVVRIESNDE